MKHRIGAIPLLLVLTVTALFAFSVKVRSPWFGQLSEGHHSFNTATTLRYAKNWYADGPLTLRFAMMENPRSVEFPTLESRLPYISFMPGSVVPIYLISLLRGQEPTVGLVMGYNLAMHLLAALLIALLALELNRACGGAAWRGGLSGAAAAAMVLLLPGPMYWLQNVFFVDQSVIVPFILFLYLETLRETRPEWKKRIDWIQALVGVWGLTSDWLMLPIAGIAFLRRAVTGRLGDGWRERTASSVAFGLPYGLTLGAFLLQLGLLGKFATLRERFFFRIGATDEFREFTDNFTTYFWGNYFSEQYGKAGLSILIFATGLLSVAGYALWRTRRTAPEHVRKNLSLLLGIGAVALLPCVSHAYLLRNYSAIHDFAALKFIVPFALLPFVLLPLCVEQLLETTLKEGVSGRLRAGLTLGATALAGLHLMLVFPQYRPMFPVPNEEWPVFAAFLRANVEERDVVFSPDFDIPADPPQLLSLTMKRAYGVDSFDDLKRIGLQNLKGNVRVTLVFLAEPGPGWREHLTGRTPIRSGKYILYRIDPKQL